MVSVTLFLMVLIISFFFTIYNVLKQKKLSEMKTDFVNNMTHEFKTPLSSIRLAAMVIQGAQEIDSNVRLKNYAKIFQFHLRIYDQKDLTESALLNGILVGYYLI